MDISISDMSSRKSHKTSPALTPAVFHILLALVEEDRHGLGIADAIEHASDGSMRLGPGTLYRSLKEMTHEGLVVEVAPRGEDPRRKFYRITAPGRKRLEAEALRYDRLVRVARGRNVLPERAP